MLVDKKREKYLNHFKDVKIKKRFSEDILEDKDIYL